MQLLQAPLPPHLSFQCSKLHNSRRGSCLLENPLLPCPSLRLLAVTILLFTSRGRTAPPGRVWVMHLPTGVRPCSKLLPLKDLEIDETLGEVLFQIELTTPACPVKDMFEQKANEVVAALPWVKNVQITMSAQPVKPVFAGQLPAGLQKISSIIAVSSCKGGVGKSAVAVNLAYTLAGMGARVGIFDADVYGPSLPTMVSPENRLLEMNPEKRTIIPTEYLGVKLVSFGFAGQGRAIMRGLMVSGVIDQLLTTTEWGELDYLVDMPPGTGDILVQKKKGTGDIQLKLCQVVPLTATVIITTPQKLAFIDVAKGVHMFSKLKVPCVAVVENMCYFDVDGNRHYPFGRGSGSQVVQQFRIPHLFDLPIRPSLSASGDSGMPEVVADPLGDVAGTFQELGVCVVQQCAKIHQQAMSCVFIKITPQYPKMDTFD